MTLAYWVAVFALPVICCDELLKSASYESDLKTPTRLDFRIFYDVITFVQL